MEQELKQLRIDNPNVIIKVEVTPAFPTGVSPQHGGPIRRPENFEVKVTVTENGVVKPNYFIDNP